jgi:hypothetical protein
MNTTIPRYHRLCWGFWPPMVGVILVLRWTVLMKASSGVGFAVFTSYLFLSGGVLLVMFALLQRQLLDRLKLQDPDLGRELFHTHYTANRILSFILSQERVGDPTSS